MVRACWFPEGVLWTGAQICETASLLRTPSALGFVFCVLKHWTGSPELVLKDDWDDGEGIKKTMPDA